MSILARAFMTDHLARTRFEGEAVARLDAIEAGGRGPRTMLRAGRSIACVERA